MVWYINNMISTITSTIKGSKVKIFITGAEVKKVDNTFVVVYKDKIIAEHPSRMGAVMHALNKDTLDQEYTELTKAG